MTYEFINVPSSSLEGKVYFVIEHESFYIVYYNGNKVGTITINSTNVSLYWANESGRLVFFGDYNILEQVKEVISTILNLMEEE